MLNIDEASKPIRLLHNLVTFIGVPGLWLLSYNYDTFFGSDIGHLEMLFPLKLDD